MPRSSALIILLILFSGLSSGCARSIARRATRAMLDCGDERVYVADVSEDGDSICSNDGHYETLNATVER